MATGTNNFTATIQQQDTTGATLARRLKTISNAIPNSGEYVQGYLTVTTEVQITLPVAQALQCFILNTHNVANITVKWTPNGGSKATIDVISPGDMIAFWHTNAVSSNGISQLSLTSDTANATYEMFLGG